MTRNLELETGYPPYFVNGYIKAQLQKFNILSGTEQMSPIFPTSPTNIDEVFKNYIAPAGVQSPLLIQYERLLRLRTSPFYVKKREQLALYLYSAELSKVLDAHRIISMALDREDAAAEDVNKWASENVISDTRNNAAPQNVHFHSFRVYQAGETRDIVNLASARTIYANKLIVEYDYHVVLRTSDFTDQDPSAPLYT